MSSRYPKHASRGLVPKILALLVFVACSGGDSEAPRRGSPPNVVVIVTDDQAFSTLPHMKHVEKHLIRQGLRLDNFILNDPICCPSRVTILLGQYRHNHLHETGWPGCASLFFIRGNHERAIGHLMHEAGYRTGMMGKYLNRYGVYYMGPPRKAGQHLMAGWDDYHVLTGNTKYVDFRMDDNGVVVHRPTGHQTDILAELAVRFIEDSSAAAKPFFLYITPQAPHSPVVAAKRHRGNYASEIAPRVPSFNRVDRRTQPSLSSTTPLSKKAISGLDISYRETLRSLQSVDELVRDVVLALESEGLVENTYIFFTSDNGRHFGEHRIRRGKGTPFEESIRFPLIVRGPGVPRDVSLPHLVSNVDLHPTLLDLVGEQPGERVDGRSLLPLITAGDHAPPWRHALVIESDHENRNQGVPRFRGIRTLRYKLIEYKTGDTELYDLEVDPYETKSVLDRADPALVAALRAHLDALAHCVGRDCQAVENESVGRDGG